MDKLQQVKAKLEEMKAKYNFERENEDNPNHSDGCGMFYSGFFACLKELSFFLNTLEVEEVDLEKEIESYFKGFGKFPSVGIADCIDIAKHFFELGLKARKEEVK